MGDKPKLLIVPGDPLLAYDAKGYSQRERAEYYNPTGAFDVTILEVPLYNSSFGPLPRTTYAGFPVIKMDRNLTGIQTILEREQPDLVRGYGDSWKVLQRIQKTAKIPSVLSVHDLGEKEGLETVDRVICVSKEVAAKHIALGLHPTKVDVIYDRVDLSLFKPYKASRGDNRMVSVSAGRFVWEKNLERLIEATEIVGKELETEYTHIHYGSGGKLEATIKEQAQRNNYFEIRGSIPQEELARKMAEADIFAMASVSEGFGLVYAEAMACGTPIVTSNQGPMNEYATNEEEGMLIDPEDPISIADGILAILFDDKFRQKLGSNARKTAEELFDGKKLAAKERDLYLEEISRRSRRNE